MATTNRHNRLISLVVLFLLAIGGATFAAPLPIAVEDDAAPWSKKDGTGFANDIVRAAFKAAGEEVELLVVPYARCKDMAIKGKAVACLSMSWLPEFSGKIVFAEKPLFVNNADYFVSLKKPLKATKEKDLPKGTVVGVVRDYEYSPSVHELKMKGILIFEESESEELNVKKLISGRIDTALVVNLNDMNPAELLLARAGASGQVKRAFRSGTQESFIGFSTKHSQGMEALKKFNRGHRIISDNGTRRKIEQKWREKAVKEVAGLTGKTPANEQ